MQVGDKIDVTEFTKGREFLDMADFVNAICKTAIVWSWGANSWTQLSPYCLRFKVQGHHHKGHVYLAVNAMDEFDIYLTTTHGKIEKIIGGVYLEDVIDRIDEAVERVPEYKQ